MMLTNQGGVQDILKILDFGLVMDLAADDAEAEERFIAGTPKYLAPECVLAANSCSPQSDLYALGAVAYFMLCGSPISTHDDIADILSQQLQGDIPFPSVRLGRELPEDLEYVVMSCLSRDPADRPSSASQLTALLEQCDCAAWTAEDASQWWATWGEAARSRRSPGVDDDQLTASGIEVFLNKSRT
jgi:serine/threonine-protein kinase